MKYFTLVLLLILSACSSIQPAPQPSPPPPAPQVQDDGKVHVFNDDKGQKKEVAIVDRVTGRATYMNGGDDTQVNLAFIKAINDLNIYHDTFKQDLLATCGPKLRPTPKIKPPKNKSAKK